MSAKGSLAAKADRYLVEGRVAAVTVARDRAEFAVAGSDPEPYRVTFLGEWLCSCPAQVAACAHILACQKITRLEPARQFLFTDDGDELSAFMRDALRS